MTTDPVSDMLTRLRNAGQARHPVVSIPASRLKLEIARILKEEGFIKNYKMVRDDRQGVLRIHLRYTSDGRSVFHGLRRSSRPGRRVYVRGREVRNVYGGIGVAIVTTSKGILTDKKCRELSVGGELLCEIW